MHNTVRHANIREWRCTFVSLVVEVLYATESSTSRTLGILEACVITLHALQQVQEALLVLEALYVFVGVGIINVLKSFDIFIVEAFHVSYLLKMYNRKGRVKKVIRQ